MKCFLISGDNRRMLRALAPDSIDSCVTDPPYGLSKEPDMMEVLKHWMDGDDYTASQGGFMGAKWDSFVPGPSTWREVYRVLKPGGHVLMFSGTRTWDMATLALRLAGFEIRDGLMWLHGMGMPKGLNISKAIDKAAGVEREVIGPGKWAGRESPTDLGLINDDAWEGGSARVATIAMTEAAQQWDGWNSSLKPAWEPIVLARKPLVGTIVANVLTYGTGALNIDESRIGYQNVDDMDQARVPQPMLNSPTGLIYGFQMGEGRNGEVFDLSKGRFPANVLLSHTEACVQVGAKQVKSDGHFPAARLADTQRIVFGDYEGQQGLVESYTSGETVEVWECADDCPVRLLDEQTGDRRSAYPGNQAAADRYAGSPIDVDRTVYGDRVEIAGRAYADQGGASRFFYNGKVSKKERNAGMPKDKINDWPTVKPIALMEYLIRLITPPEGTVLDPFVGSGSTGVAAVNLRHQFVGLDSDAHALAIAQFRIMHVGGNVETLGKVEY